VWDDDPDLWKEVAMNTDLCVQVIFNKTQTVNLSAGRHQISARRGLTLRSTFYELKEQLDRKFSSLPEGKGTAELLDFSLVAWNETKLQVGG
jgi:hypothetical protein